METESLRLINGKKRNRCCVTHCLWFLSRAPAVCSPFDPRRVYSYIVGRLRNGGPPLRLMVQALLARFAFWPRVAYVLSCPLRFPMTIKSEASAGTGDRGNKTGTERSMLRVFFGMDRHVRR